MIRPLVIAAVTLSAVALSAAPAPAQETRASALAKLDAEFRTTDTNKNGVLTRSEVETRMSRMKVGARSLDAVHAKRVAALWFANTDANKDGKVTRAESRATMAAVFDRYDANGDGKLTRDERAQAAAAAKAGPKTR